MTTLKDHAVKRIPIVHPQGWEPSVVWDGKEGTLCTGPLSDEPDSAIWANLIVDWGLDPNVTQIVDGSVQVRAWDANIGGGDVRRFKYYRATLKARQSADSRADIDALCKLVERRKPRSPVRVDQNPERGLVVLLSDWQIGKGEGGGTPATTERILASFDGVYAQIKELRKAGRGPDVIYVIGMGDIVEQCDGHYPMQAFSVDLDRREQMRLARRLILSLVDGLLQFDIPIVLGAVPGNHGENRRDGKAFTTWTDNDDLAVFDGVAEIFASNPSRYGGVTVPIHAIADDLTMTLDVAGVPCGFAHGHQMRGGAAGSQTKIEKWFAGQTLGRQEVADAAILFTGHLHHFMLSEATGRTVVQCPAMDGGSYWWVARSGQEAPSGLLTLGVGSGYGGRGWGDLQIL